MKVINLKLSDNVEEKLILKAAFKGFDTVHEYIEYMLAAIIDHEDSIALIPLLIKNLKKLEEGAIFSVKDLIEFNNSKFCSILLLQELDALLQLHLVDTNQEKQFEIINMDSIFLINNYIKLSSN